MFVFVACSWLYFVFLCCSFIVAKSALFSDAKVFEDVVEDGFAAHFAGDFAEAAYGGAQVFAEEVGGEALPESVEDLPERGACALQGFVVALVAYDDALGVLFGCGLMEQERFEVVESAALPCGCHGVGQAGGGEGLAELFLLPGADEVCFVDDDDDAALWMEFVDFPACVGDGLWSAGGVGHPEQDGGVADGPERALYAHLLDAVGGGAHAGGVDEAEGESAEGDGVFDDVACGAADVADDGAFFAEQGVEEGGFAHVGLADDGDGEAVFDGVAGLEGVGEGTGFVFGFFDELPELCAVGKLEFFVVAEVEFELHEGGDVEEAVAQLPESLAELSAHLADGEMVGGGVAGSDEVGYAFGLTEVHFAVEEGALGVFAGPGHAAALAGEELHDALEDVG